MPSSKSLLTAAATSLAAGASLFTGAAFVDSQADRREAEWAAQYPPLGALIQVDGHAVHVLETGQPRGAAPDLVLIHGASGNLRDFTFKLVERLTDDYRVIAVDRPGLGWSDSWGEIDSDPAEQARILRLATAGLGLEQPIILGHSYGGAVAMGWALQAPQETGAIVLLAGATHPWGGGGLGFWYWLNDTPMASTARAMVSAFVPDATVQSTLEAIFAPDPVPDGYGDYIGTGLSLRRDSLESNTRQVNALEDYLTRMQPRYAALTLPIEIVHGDADKIVLLDLHSRRMADEVESARLTILPGAGHMPHHSHTDAVIAAIRRAADRRRDAE